MSYSPRYDRGDWKCICDSCGRIVKGSQLMKRWDGFMVDERCWEPRQPQDFVRGVADYQAPPFTRPEPSDNFIPFNWVQSFFSKLKSTATLTYFMLPIKILSYLANSTSIATILTVFGYSKPLNQTPLNKQTLG